MNKRKLFYPLLSLLPLLSQAQEGTYRYDDATRTSGWIPFSSKALTEC